MRQPKTVAAIGIAFVIAAVIAGWLLVKKRDDLDPSATQTDPAAPTAPSHPSDSSSDSSPESPAPSSPTPPDSEMDAPSSWGPTTAQLAEAQQAAAAMSNTELAGQVIIAHWSGSEAESAAQIMTNFHLAGLIFMANNIKDAPQLEKVSDGVQNEQQKAGRTWPAIISVDQEGGRVARLGKIIDEVPAFAQVAAQGPAATRKIMEHMAHQMRELGFTMDFAPVADVSIGKQDPTIGDRAAGKDPHAVSEAVQAAVTGLRAGGIVPVIKHFPGHGSVTVDSHLAVPVQDRDLNELREKDFVPFADAIAAGVPVIMMGHIAVTDLDPEVPATLSPPVYDLLRTELGFEGVIVTDAMNMRAITDNMKSGEETVAALAAGADLVLMPPDTKKAHAAVVAALESGKLSRTEIEAAATRVIALQIWSSQWQ